MRGFPSVGVWCVVLLAAFASAVACGGPGTGHEDALEEADAETVDAPDADADDGSNVEGTEDGTDVEATEDGETDSAPPCPAERAAELGGACNAVFQCGCTLGMGRCLIDFDGPAGPVEVCVPVSYCHPELGCMCGGDDDACYPGMQCFGRSPESEGRCEQFCYDDWDCPSGRLCERDIAGVTRGDGSGYRLCGDVSTTCDPFTGSGCRSGEACLILPPDGWFSCLTPGTAGPDEPCDASGCVSGSGCFVWDTNGDTVVGSGDEFRCFAYCTLDGSSHPCPVDHTCRDDLGHAEIGLCVGP